MSENKDPLIKLFSKTIQLGSYIDEARVIASKIEPFLAVSSTKDDIHCDYESTTIDQKFPCSKQNENRVNEELTSEEPRDTEQEGERSSKDIVMSSSQDLPKNDQESSNSESSYQNPLKELDKILPCDKCSNMSTKINNHLCKNCQRYYCTAGGSMRTVPVGRGRRKCKNSAASQHRQLVIPGASNGLIHHIMMPDGTVLAFGVDNSLSLGEESHNFLRNGFLRTQDEKKSPLSLSNSDTVVIQKNGDCNAGQVVPCFPYGWNPTASPESFLSGSSSTQWGENLAAPWNLNWVPTPSINFDLSSTSSSSNSSSLGKHSRECLTLMPSNSDNKESEKEQKDLESSRVVVPKTLRVGDPSRAAKSSIWTTLGIKHDHIGSSRGRLAFFGGLQQAKGVPYERRNINQNVEASSMVLQANPAAFSRSSNFRVPPVDNLLKRPPF